jgi:hypothetical protein
MPDAAFGRREQLAQRQILITRKCGDRKYSSFSLLVNPHARLLLTTRLVALLLLKLGKVRMTLSSESGISGGHWFAAANHHVWNIDANQLLLEPSDRDGKLLAIKDLIANDIPSLGLDSYPILFVPHSDNKILNRVALSGVSVKISDKDATFIRHERLGRFESLLPLGDHGLRV